MSDYSLIAIHGNGGGGFRFERLKPFIPPTVNFVAPTLPGFSDVKPDPNLKTLKDYAFKLREMIKNEPTPMVLLGTGIGGSIALEFLQHFEHDVQGLILHAPVGTRLNQRLFPKLMKPVFIRRFGQWLFSSTLARPLFKPLLFQSPEQIPAEYLKKFFDEYRRCQAFSQMFDIINDAWFQSLRPSNIPAVLLWGEKCKAQPPQKKQYRQSRVNHRKIQQVFHKPFKSCKAITQGL